MGLGDKYGRTFFLPGDKGLNNAIYKAITNITIASLTLFMLFQKKTTLLRELFIFLLIFGAYCSEWRQIQYG